MTSVQGTVAPGYEPVREAFERNFSELGDVGAAFAAVVDGRPVVDLWGGVADPARAPPWREDTLQLVFSGTKGFVAACVLMLIERGQLALDQPVARYWPEFAAAGKGDVLVGHVVSHAPGLPAFREPRLAATISPTTAAWPHCWRSNGRSGRPGSMSPTTASRTAG